MKIGEIARRTNIPASAIRYYERIGILPEPPRSGGQRWYDEARLEELQAIKLAQKLGFNLEEIGTLLDSFRSSGEPSGECRSLAERKLHELEQIISEAQQMMRILEHGIACNCTSLRGCYLKDAE